MKLLKERFTQLISKMITRSVKGKFLIFRLRFFSLFEYNRSHNLIIESNRIELGSNVSSHSIFLQRFVTFPTKLSITTI